MQKYIDQDLTYLENLLGRTLRPVTPRAEFVNQLRSRLSSPPVQIIERAGARDTIYLLLPLVSVIGAILIVATNVRLILSLIGVLGLAQQVQQQKNQKRLTSTPAT